MDSSEQRSGGSSGHRGVAASGRPLRGRLRDRHLRQLFAEDPTGARRWRSPPATSSSTTPSTGPRRGHGRPDGRGPPGRGRGAARTPCSPAGASTPPRTGPCSTWRCGCPGARHLEVDGRDVVADVHAVLDPMGAVADAGSARASGPATPASGSAPWSTSASAGPTSDRPWPTRRCGTTPTRPSSAGSSRTSTRSTSTTRPTTSTRPRRCSWSAPRPSPPWRR